VSLITSVLIHGRDVEPAIDRLNRWLDSRGQLHLEAFTKVPEDGLISVGPKCFNPDVWIGAFNFADVDELLEQLSLPATWDGILWPAAVVVDTEGDECTVVLARAGRVEVIGDRGAVAR
jgi:hypothetical protein